MSLFFVDQKKCHRDGLCAAECPAKIIEINDPEGFPAPIPDAEEFCIQCGHCVAICPHGALTLKTVEPKDCLPVKKELLLSAEHCEHFLRSRRSIRNYKEKPVPHELLKKLIEVVRYAPSGHNSQPVHWMVFENRETVKHLATLVADWMRWMLKENSEYALMMHFDRVVTAFGQGVDRILRDTPHLIVAYGLSTLPAAQPACIIALTYLELAAPCFGLGTCWAGYFNAAANNYPPLQEFLALPKDHLPYGAAMIGYPKFGYQRMPPRNAPDITWRD